MKFQILLMVILFFSITTSYSQGIPAVSSGKIVRIENFQSKYVEPRNIDIWLPEGYSKNKKYAVLYMEDGQMLFDSTITWNHQAWDVADVATKLMKKGEVQNFIVVGIWNSGINRFSDYFPQKPYESLSQAQRDSISMQLQKAGASKGEFKPASDDYLKFLVNELKPHIDERYSVYTDRKHTFVVGSSMGALISIYAICEYPKIFGGAACLSTHWTGTFTLEYNPIPAAFCNYLKAHLPNPGQHRIYFDCGNKTLDAMYPQIQKKVDEIMRLKGYTSKDWMTRFYPGADHSERSWHKRLHVPLLFLLKK